MRVFVLVLIDSVRTSAFGNGTQNRNSDAIKFLSAENCAFLFKQQLTIKVRAINNYFAV